MKRLLLISPHFPPDTSAGTHRARLLAPHLAAHGWEPTVLTVDPRDHEGRLDPELEGLVPGTVRVVRCRAWPAARSRRLGFGDLGLRAFRGLRRAALELLQADPYDALFITIYPTYPALLGGGLGRRFRLPFVLDYQDPWVGEWGRSVGGGVGGRVDLRSRLSRALACRLEPMAARAADALTAVSAGTYARVLERYPDLAGKPCLELPIGGEPADFERVRADPRPNGLFDPGDGRFHLCYVGTLLPTGTAVLTAFLEAVARLRGRAPEVYARLALHFVGTSNQTDVAAAPRVLPLAERAGVADRVSEHPARVDYLPALRVLVQASGILLLGSDEPHYTPSKIYPAVLASRPLLGLYRRESSACEALRTLAAGRLRLVDFETVERLDGAALDRALGEMLQSDEVSTGTPELGPWSARAIAGRLAGLLDRLRATAPGGGPR